MELHTLCFYRPLIDKLLILRYSWNDTYISIYTYYMMIIQGKKKQPVIHNQDQKLYNFYFSFRFFFQYFFVS